MPAAALASASALCCAASINLATAAPFCAFMRSNRAATASLHHAGLGADKSGNKANRVHRGAIETREA